MQMTLRKHEESFMHDVKAAILELDIACEGTAPTFMESCAEGEALRERLNRLYGSDGGTGLGFQRLVGHVHWAEIPESEDFDNVSLWGNAPWWVLKVRFVDDSGHFREDHWRDVLRSAAASEHRRCLWDYHDRLCRFAEMVESFMEL